MSRIAACSKCIFEQGIGCEKWCINQKEDRNFKSLREIMDEKKKTNKQKTQCFRCLTISNEVSKYGMCNNCQAATEYETLGMRMTPIEEHKEYLSSIDPVNHPPHYTTGQFEVINILEDKLSKEEFKGFLKGNILKYVFRADHKGGKTDLEKAKWYLVRLIGDEK